MTALVLPDQRSRLWAVLLAALLVLAADVQCEPPDVRGPDGWRGSVTPASPR